MAKIQLGDLVKCKITGFKGTAVARTQWISGCDRINVQPRVDKDGKVPDPQSFDETMLVVVKALRSREYDHDTGGPRLTMKQKD